ncbi:MAG: hypothetical protein HFI00_07445 [Lachnospiraceae bacterium]|jgi:hypothetical protein|nr:hypothetical protein [Lachnospiraceae bacterium]
MLNNFKFSRWEIAYRQTGEGKFHLIPNPPYGWCADPFLVEYHDTIYLFAEIFLYKSERNGVIGYCTYENGRFGAWTVTMDKHWHLSYPNVFVYEGSLYMCPESYQKEEVGIYRLIEFPDHWEKVVSLLENGKYVDTTFLKREGQEYLFTFQPSFHRYGGVLLQYTIKDCKALGMQIITEDKSIARPAGNFIEESGKLIRVSQNSSNSYGEGLVFSEIDSLFPKYQEHTVRNVYPEDILIEGKQRKYVGIHTYNRCRELEVIDLKYTCYSLKEWIARKRVRKVFLNKYGR